MDPQQKGVALPAGQIQAEIEHLKQWMAKEPHLPSINDDKWLMKFLLNNKFSLEKTKFKLENYYSSRSKYPEIFRNRDPAGVDVLKVNDYFKQVPSTKVMKDGTWIVHVQYSGDGSTFDRDAYLKKLFMIWDYHLLEGTILCTSVVSIINFKNVSYSFALKLLPVLSLQADILGKSYTMRSKAVHVINLPNYAHTIYETAMHFCPKKLRKRLIIHADADTLFDTLDEDAVSRDFGGKGPSLKELEENAQKRMEIYRQWFKEQDDIRSNELLRRKDYNALEEMRGSFKKLEVD